jgi:hypothetical protein
MTRRPPDANARHPQLTRALVNPTVFLHVKFWLLIAFSSLLPIAIYWVMLTRRAIAPLAVLVFGLALVVIAGVDVYLIQGLSAAAKLTSSSADDVVFDSELTLALYVFPALFGGIGVNLLSHVLIRHLGGAERKFEKEHRDA